MTSIIVNLMFLLAGICPGDSVLIPGVALWPRIVEMYEWDETHCWRRIRILAIREAAEGGGMQALLMSRGRPECFYLNFLQEWLMKFINTSLSFGQTGEGEVTIDFFFGSDVL